MSRLHIWKAVYVSERLCKLGVRLWYLCNLISYIRSLASAHAYAVINSNFQCTDFCADASNMQ